jgi:hypothetical protein
VVLLWWMRGVTHSGGGMIGVRFSAPRHPPAVADHSCSLSLVRLFFTHLDLMSTVRDDMGSFAVPQKTCLHIFGLG